MYYSYFASLWADTTAVLLSTVNKATTLSFFFFFQYIYLTALNAYTFYMLS